MNTVTGFICLLLCFQLLPFFSAIAASTVNQADNLFELIKSRQSENPPNPEPWAELGFANKDHCSPSYVRRNLLGSMEADKIDRLPGQPEGVDFNQYAGYVTVDPAAGRALFYYFVESPNNSLTNPLVLWLNGGPGCSSVGHGAMSELGPFRVNDDGKTLYRNEYAWNNVANVLFLDSPAGVGFSYSNTSSDYTTVGDKRTAEDSYTFLLNWLQRFPQYKNRDFYVTGESYAGHFVPQLAYTILSNNKTTNQAGINLKGITIGNGWLDNITGTKGIYDYFWTHALNSDETHAGITKYCDYVTGNFTGECLKFQRHAHREIRKLDIYNIYAPLCHSSALKSPPSPGSVKDFDPCYINYVRSYMNLPEVQTAFHARTTKWLDCNTLQKKSWADSPLTVLPTIKQLIASGIRLWLYSGDIDGRFPVTSTRYSINSLELPVETEWRPWFSADEVGGYVVGYKGLVLVTVRAAGHQVPSYQPERALVMFSHFLQDTLPPSS